MHTYKRKGSPFYYYEFEIRGHRFRGSTKATSKREADDVTKAEYKRALKDLESRPRFGGAEPMTVNEALDRYWTEKGQFLPRPDQVLWSMSWLLDFFGETLLLSSITNADIARMVAKRRSEPRINRTQDRARAKTRKTTSKKKISPAKLVSASTVNRSVTEPLRKVMNRARDVWEQQIHPIKWSEHLLKEPGERVRAATLDEEQLLFENLPAQYRPIVTFAIRTGCRVSECINLPWSAIDWSTRTMTILGKGKKIAPVPMSTDIRDLLWSLKGQHPDRVFVYPQIRVTGPSGKERIVPARPMTYSGVDTAFNRAVKNAGLSNLRFHDLRHTAATRLLRDTGNLKMVQKLLRHNDIQTTAKYAHVLDDDLREALDRQAEKSSQPAPTKTPTNVAKSEKSQ